MFTRSGSVAASPPFPRDVRDCLHTWRERLLMLAQVQHTPEWTETNRGFPAYERAVSVFVHGDDDVAQELLEKPVHVEDVASLYDRCAIASWAFAICPLTFVRHAHAEPPEKIAGPPVPDDATWASVAHAVAVFDLKHRRLAGVCFMRLVDEQPVPLIVAADKLLDAFRADLATAHVIAPVSWHDELEFLPWLLYAMRAPDVAEAIRRAEGVPAALRLTPAEFLFWGFRSDFEEVSDRTAVFPKPTVESSSVLVGLNFALRVEGRSIDVNVRLCQAGVEKGHPPHLDIQISDKTVKRSPLHGVKLAEHVAVDLSRFATYGLQCHLLAYLRLRPNVALAPMVGALATEESLAMNLAMIRDPLYQEIARRTLDLEPEVLERMLGVFNAVYRIDIEASRTLEREIGVATDARWREAEGAGRGAVVEAAVRLWRARLIAAQDHADTAEATHLRFLSDGRAALAVFEAEIAKRG